MKKFLLLALLATLLPISVSKAEGALDRPVEMKFTAVDGRKVDVSAMRGKVILVDFWATWCGPCRAEAPNVVDAYKKYHKDGFEVVGISLDQDKDSLVDFTKQSGMVWPQYFDGQGWENAISSHYGVDSVPAMFLIGRDGKPIIPSGNLGLDGEIEKALKAK